MDDYHRIIDVNKMENDIESYRKWSPLHKDYYKIYNSNYTYKNIFPLNFKSNKINTNNNNRYKSLNLNNIIEKNFIKKSFDNMDRNLIKYNKLKMKSNYDFKKNNTNNDLDSSNILKLNQYDINQEKKEKNRTNQNNFNKIGNNELVNMHLLNKRDVYRKHSYNSDNNLNPLNNIKLHNLKRDEYYFKFNDYYLNENLNSNSSRDINFDTDIYENKNSIKDNYYNHINDENRHLNNVIIKQREKNERLAKNINNLNERISELKFRTPQKNHLNKDFYYHKNRSFATLFDSIQNKMQEENDYDIYKKYKKEQEYTNFY